MAEDKGSEEVRGGKLGMLVAAIVSGAKPLEKNRTSCGLSVVGFETKPAKSSQGLSGKGPDLVA